jgi:hypothetical protein
MGNFQVCMPLVLNCELLPPIILVVVLLYEMVVTPSVPFCLFIIPFWDVILSTLKSQ